MQQGIYALGLIAAVPAAAQEAPLQNTVPAVPPAIPDMQDASPAPFVDPKTDVFDGDYVIVGIGVGGVPTYEGSDKMRLLPVAGAYGRIARHKFRIRGPNLSVDLIHHSPGRHLRFRFGPTIRYTGNRTGGIKDDVVEKLGKLKSGFEGGVSFGAAYRRLFHSYDSLSLSGSVRWDLSGRHGGTVYGSALSYTTPLSRAQVLGVRVSASFSDDDYADYNYSVTPGGSAASGLPVYKAKGGLKELNVGAFTARDLSGDFRDGGFSLGVGALYGRLQGSAAETPITSIRGSADQWIVGGGLSYTF